SYRDTSAARATNFGGLSAIGRFTFSCDGFEQSRCGLVARILINKSAGECLLKHSASERSGAVECSVDLDSHRGNYGQRALNLRHSPLLLTFGGYGYRHLAK